MSENIAATAPKPRNCTSVPAAPRTSPTVRKRPRHLEDDLQAACVKWFRLQYSHLASLLFAIPNGGNRSAREGSRLKAQGVVAGVPDLLLAVSSLLPDAWKNQQQVEAHGLFLELKVGKNKPSPEQVQMIDKLEGQGYETAVVYTFDEFRAAIRQYLGY